MLLLLLLGLVLMLLLRRQIPQHAVDGRYLSLAHGYYVTFEKKRLRLSTVRPWAIVACCGRNKDND